MKTLYLLRHAKAEAGGKDISDPERTLSARGREACVTVGSYIKSKAYLPAFGLCSSSARTKETWERVTQAAGISPKHQFKDSLYLASAEEIMHSVQNLDEAVPSAMVVGHNPGMHHISLLLSESTHTPLRTELELKYPTCALTVLTFDIREWGDVAPGKGKLADFITPGEL